MGRDSNHPNKCEAGDRGFWCRTFRGLHFIEEKEYLEWITEAKTAATRDKRLAQAVEWMAEGKVKNWNYINCWKALQH